MRKLRTILYGLGFLMLAAALMLTVWNIRTDQEAGESAKEVLEELEISMQDENPVKEDSEQPTIQLEPQVQIPDHLLNPDMDMPVKNVDGKEYVGIITMHQLGIELPVMSDWSYSKLKQAPCLYSGSVYQDNLVIMAHNYRSQFGRIRRLTTGSQITFTDMDGNVFAYLVAAIEVLDPLEVENVTNGEWDLTLFTCTLGGESRVVVRCEKES